MTDQSAPPVHCYRHHDRRAGVSCQRCGRPICPSCMVQASVGFQCPECVRDASRSAPVYSTRTLPRDRPWVTYALIALNLAVFVAELATIDRGSNVVLGLESEITLRGSLYGPAVAAGEWWRLITAGFVHYGILHVGMNMYVLYMIGPQLERLLGSVRFAVLYLGSLLAGSLGVMLVSPNSLTAGASGAIFGLLGAAAAYQLSQHINLWRSGLGQLILLNVVITFGFASYISVGAHIGGLIGGVAVGWALFQLEQHRQPAALGLALGVVFALGCAFTAVALAPSPLTLYR